MLYHDAALSFLHFAFAFLLAGALSAEAFVLRLPVNAQVARLLLRIDLFYAIAAIGVILAGLSRVFVGAAGPAYYATQPFFWAKMAAFATVALISIAPTLTFIRWNKAARGDANFAVPDADAKKMRRLVMIELHVFVLIPLFAALMARGIGS
jgi:putative membrane protein